MIPTPEYRLQTLTQDDDPLLFLNRTARTTGAPNTAVTVLIDSSVGAKTVLAIRSHIRQKNDPPRKHPGIRTIGFEVLKRDFTR